MKMRAFFTCILKSFLCMLLHMIGFAQTCYSNTIIDWVGPLVLCEEEISRIPPEIPGIYMLHSFNPHRGRYTAIYVGKTGDLTRRLIQHMETQSTSPDVRLLRLSLQMYFTAAPVFERTERDSIEAGLIRLLRPACNRQVPRVSPVYPNLPLFAISLS